MSESSTASTARDNAALLADLTDLLQLELDALPSYAVAISGLRRQDQREMLQRFRADHEQHVRDLSVGIRRYGGIPLPLPHLPPGLLKLGVQLSGLPGG